MVRVVARLPRGDNDEDDHGEDGEDDGGNGGYGGSGGNGNGCGPHGTKETLFLLQVIKMGLDSPAGMLRILIDARGEGVFTHLFVASECVLLLPSLQS